MATRPLEGKIAVVAGATRGAGRGIACELGEAGATVYCTGRSVRGWPASGKNRPETIEETAEMVTDRGGVGIHVQADHTVPGQVEALFERIKSEQPGLDILINDVWGGDALTEWGKTLWSHSLDKGLLMIERAVHSHIITSHFGVPLMLDRPSGLIVEITDGNFYGYRGNFFYDFVKTSVIRLAFSMARELRKTKVSAVAVTPGFLRSEEMLEHFGVAEANWQDGAKRDANFMMSETPFFVGHAVAALAADPNVSEKTGRVFSSWDLSDEYDFTDVDGRQPHWGRHFEKTYGRRIKNCDDPFYEYWFDNPMESVLGDWP